MAGPLSEYIAAAIILAIRNKKTGGFPQDWDQLQTLFANEYALKVDKSILRVGVEKMRDWEVATVISDEYAGDMLQLSRVQSDPVFSRLNSVVLKRASLGGVEWLQKVFRNDTFWGDFNREIDGDPPEFIVTSTEAPASDRIVSFSDNQVNELDTQASELIEAVSNQNQIADASGARELIVGQLKAGRELIRAGSFRLYFLQLTLIDTLTFLAKRYEKEAIGALAASLIAALFRHIGLEA